MSSGSLRIHGFANANRTITMVLFTDPSHSVNSLLLEASSKTNGDKAYTKAFLTSGAELTDMAHLRDDDHLFFSEGEDFIRSSAGEFGQGGSAGLLQGIALHAMSVSSELYQTYVPKVKEALPLVATPIEKVEKLYTGMLQPRANGVYIDYGIPALQWADTALQGVYVSAMDKSETFLNSEMGQKAHSILIEKAYKPSETFVNKFYQAAVANYRSLDKEGKGKVTLTDFVVGMKGVLGEKWHEKLQAPAETFYHHIQDETAKLVEKHEGQTQLESVFNNVKASLGPAWEKAIESGSSMVPARIRNPAEAYYQAAVESFVALRMSAEEKGVEMKEFIAAMRVKLGGLWEQKLQPVTEKLFHFLSKTQTGQNEPMGTVTVEASEEKASEEVTQ